MLPVSVQSPTPTAAPPAPLAPLAPLAPPQSFGAPVIVDGEVRTLGAAPNAHAMLMAVQARRDELREQVQQLEGKREELNQQIREDRHQGMDITGLEARVKQIDARISAVDQQVAMADAEVAKQAAVPGAVVEQSEPMVMQNGPPDAVWVLSAIFIITVLMPISIALARRLWKRGGPSAPALPSDVGDRLRAIESAVESVAVEVERIGEGQRFMSRVLTDRPGAADARAIGEGAAQAVEIPQRQKVAESR